MYVLFNLNVKILKGCAGYLCVKLGKQIEVKLCKDKEKQKSNSQKSISEEEEHAKWPD